MNNHITLVTLFYLNVIFSSSCMQNNETISQEDEEFVASVLNFDNYDEEVEDGAVLHKSHNQIPSEKNLQVNQKYSLILETFHSSDDVGKKPEYTSKFKFAENIMHRGIGNHKETESKINSFGQPKYFLCRICEKKEQTKRNIRLHISRKHPEILQYVEINVEKIENWYKVIPLDENVYKNKQYVSSSK